MDSLLFPYKSSYLSFAYNVSYAMSLSSDGIPDYESYSDLRRDFVKTEVASFQEEHDASGSLFWSPGQEIETVDERGSMAELVAIDMLTLRARFRSEGVDLLDEVSTLDARFELSTESSMENLPGVTSEQKAPTGQGSSDTISTGTGASMETEQFKNTEVIKTWYLTSVMYPDDDVNGGQGGGDWEEGPRDVFNFRDHFKHGPVFDRQDTLWLHALLQGIAAANLSWQASFEGIFYWNDFEVDQSF